MLAVKLHRNPRPLLAKDDWLIPIIDWKSGRVQVRVELKYRGKKYRYITLLDIPDDWPVSFLVRYGDSNYLKSFYLPLAFAPLRDWPPETKQTIREWWDARSSIWSDTGVEPGGLMCDEPCVILGKKLPNKHVKWTKDLRLFLHGNERRKKDFPAT